MPSIFKQYENADDVVKIPDVDIDSFKEFASKKDFQNEDTDDSIDTSADKEEPVKTLSQADLREMFKDDIEAICNAARKEAYEEAYNTAYADGYKQGEEKAYEEVHAKLNSEIQGKINETDDLLQTLETEYENYFFAYKKELKFFAINIAEKILQDRITTDAEALNKMVSDIISNIKNENWISVEISGRLVETIAMLKKELKNSDFQGTIKVKGVQGEADECVIRTESGSIIATPSLQLKNLEKAFDNQDKQI